MHKDYQSIYNEIDNTFESWDLRIATALMVNKAVSSKTAIDPGKLPKRYEDNVHLPIQKDLVRSVNGKVYLTIRGKLCASDGMKHLVDNRIWPLQRPPQE